MEKILICKPHRILKHIALCGALSAAYAVGSAFQVVNRLFGYEVEERTNNHSDALIYAGIMLFISAILAIYQHRSFVRIDQHGITHRVLVKRRSIKWADVTDIDVDITLKDYIIRSLHAVIHIDYRYDNRDALRHILEETRKNIITDRGML